MQRAAAAPVADLGAIVGAGGLVVLAPHPDDESLGCGGLLRAAAMAGRRISVVAITDGRLSHRHSPTVDADALAALRTAELEAAVAALHPTIRLVQLGYPDGGAPHEAAAAVRIASIVDAAGATALVASWGGDPHPDHEATATLGRHVSHLRPALRRWSYPIWGRFAPGAGHLAEHVPIVRFETEPYRDAKAAAIACHRSQMTALIDDDPTGFVMDPGMQAHFIAYPEVFLAD